MSSLLDDTKTNRPKKSRPKRRSGKTGGKNKTGKELSLNKLPKNAHHSFNKSRETVNNRLLFFKRHQEFLKSIVSIAFILTYIRPVIDRFKGPKTSRFFLLPLFLLNHLFPHHNARHEVTITGKGVIKRA